MQKLVAAAFAVMLAASVAEAQTPATLRGKVAAVAGDEVTMTSREGETVKVHLDGKTRFLAVIPATEADLKPNAFIGVAAVPEGEGLMALEVHVFPEAMRGTGEGYRAFDLAPKSSMTNGSLGVRITGAEGDKVTVNYKGGSKEIRIPKTTPIVQFAPGARDDVKPGASAIVRGTKGADGIEAAAVLVGRDGLVPPM